MTEHSYCLLELIQTCTSGTLLNLFTGLVFTWTSLEQLHDTKNSILEHMTDSRFFIQHSNTRHKILIDSLTGHRQTATTKATTRNIELSWQPYTFYKNRREPVSLEMYFFFTFWNCYHSQCTHLRLTILLLRIYAVNKPFFVVPSSAITLFGELWLTNKVRVNVWKISRYDTDFDEITLIASFDMH